MKPIISAIRAEEQNIEKIIEQNNFEEYGTVKEVMNALYVYMYIYIHEFGLDKNRNRIEHKACMGQTNNLMFREYKEEFNPLVADLEFNTSTRKEKGLHPTYYAIVSSILDQTRSKDMWLVDSEKISII